VARASTAFFASRERQERGYDFTAVVDRFWGVRRKRGRCKLAAGVLSAILVAVPLAAAAAASASGGRAVGGDRYEGSTNQGQATAIVVSANGRFVTAVLTAVVYNDLCAKRGGPAYQVRSTSRVAIKPGGSFALVARSTTAGPGSRLMRITGTFDGTLLRGAIAQAGRNAHCSPPRQRENPYQATFTARGTPASSP
jgi:hypothetical protein